MARPSKIDDLEFLDRALELFWTLGPEATSIRDLELALDLKAPSIYRRYATKDDLLAACIDRYVDRIVRGRVRRLLDAEARPLVGLRAFFSTVLTPFAGEDRPRGCLLTVTAGQPVVQVPVVSAAVAGGFGAIGEAFAVQLGRAIEQGEVAPDADVEALAASLLLTYQGLLVMARAGAQGLEAGVDATFAALAA